MKTNPAQTRDQEFGHRKAQTVTSRIVESVTGQARDAIVKDVRIGLGYTAVMLQDDRTGVAYTFRDQARGGCTVFDGLLPLAGRPAIDVLALIESEDPIEASVALACANALANRPNPDFTAADILTQLDLRSSDDVVMVGHFRPLVRPLRDRCRSLTVLERIDEPQGEILPAVQAKQILPQSQVALLTATSIINHSIDDLLGWASTCREVVVLGASTPLLPEVFSDAGVTMLSGSVVRDPEAILRVVSEGGGMRLFSPYVQKVCWRHEAKTVAGNSREVDHTRQ